MTEARTGRQMRAATGAVMLRTHHLRPSRWPSRSRGYSLIEILVAMVVSATLLSMGIPRFQQSLEQSRANVAGANLRAIWSAQRLYWLENRTYAPDLPTLLSANLIDPSLTSSTAPYTYVVAGSTDSWFTATATRAGCACWSGTLTIAADGTFSGSIQQGNGTITIVPGFQ
jgi:prepilin-type N-terminal cleavage/methylation domain-containing protein